MKDKDKSFIRYLKTRLPIYRSCAKKYVKKYDDLTLILRYLQNQIKEKILVDALNERNINPNEFLKYIPNEIKKKASQGEVMYKFLSLLEDGPKFHKELVDAGFMSNAISSYKQLLKKGYDIRRVVISQTPMNVKYKVRRTVIYFLEKDRKLAYQKVINNIPKLQNTIINRINYAFNFRKMHRGDP